MVKRRDFLKQTVVGAATGAAFLAGCASKDTTSSEDPGATKSDGSVIRKKIVWKLASSFPPGLDTIYGASEVLAHRLEVLSGGGFTVRVYSGGEIVPALKELDAVQAGTVQVGHTASYYFRGKNPALVFDTALPFGLTARQQFAWLYQGGGLELMRGVFADFNIINFPGGNTGCQMGGWFREELGSVADLTGLKMRIPGLGGAVMDRLGVNVQVLAGGEIYPALERGVIDATEWVGPYDDLKLGFQKIAQNYYYPGWWEPGPGLSFLVNRSAWDSLPAEYQAAFETASAEAALTMMNRYDTLNPSAFNTLKAQGIGLKPFPSDIMKAAETASRELIEEETAADAGFRKIYESWKKFRDDSMAYFGTAEHSYLNYMAKK